jgi:hypothetical protein
MPPQAYPLIRSLRLEQPLRLYTHHTNDPQPRRPDTAASNTTRLGNSCPLGNTGGVSGNMPGHRRGSGAAGAARFQILPHRATTPVPRAVLGVGPAQRPRAVKNIEAGISRLEPKGDSAKSKDLRSTGLAPETSSPRSTPHPDDRPADINMLPSIRAPKGR